MFDISFTELLLVAVLAIVFIGPKEFPVVLRFLARMFFQFKKLWQEIKEAMNEVARESGLNDIKRELEDEYLRDIKMIEGNDGNMYEAYDMGDLPLDKIIDVPANTPQPKQHKLKHDLPIKEDIDE